MVSSRGNNYEFFFFYVSEVKIALCIQLVGLLISLPLTKEKQVRTNIRLADTLIPSSVRYLIYVGGTGHCDLIKIIFGYHVNT